MEESWRNTYLGLRHGLSEANVAKVIASSPANALSGWGLTSEGAAVVRRSCEAALDEGVLGPETIILTSDFKRTVETAAIAAEVIDAAPPRTEEALRERDFGELEMRKIYYYPLVWAQDSLGLKGDYWGVENVDHLEDRLSALICRLESRYQDQTILLVSHCDPLQVLKCWFSDTNVARHRDLPTLQPGEIIRFNA